MYVTSSLFATIHKTATKGGTSKKINLAIHLFPSWNILISDEIAKIVVFNNIPFFSLIFQIEWGFY